jgi:GTPase SAR1 family protein
MPNNPNPTLVHRKIAVLGFRAVGKTSLTNAFVSGTFSDNYDPTIENTHHKTIRFRKVHFATDIIDTAGMVSSMIYGLNVTFPIWIGSISNPTRPNLHPTPQTG